VISTTTSTTLTPLVENEDQETTIIPEVNEKNTAADRFEETTISQIDDVSTTTVEQVPEVLKEVESTTKSKFRRRKFFKNQ
jgi:hypothetical protein